MRWAIAIAILGIMFGIVGVAAPQAWPGVPQSIWRAIAWVAIFGIVLVLGWWLFPKLKRGIWRIDFGSPVQRSMKSGEAWWHIPVVFESPIAFIRPISECEVRMLIERANDQPIVLEMHWGDATRGRTEPRRTLYRKQPILVPIVYRVEGNARQEAVTTDKRFLEKSDTGHCFPPDGEYKRFRLEIAWATNTRTSERFYLVRVPPETTNGHFSVEVQFQGFGES